MVTNETTYNESIAAAVRAELGRQGKKYIELAPLLGLSRATVYRLVEGDKPYDVLALEKIADFLGITVQDIFDSAEFGRRLAAREQVAA